MKVTVSGSYGGQSVSVTWSEPGILTGESPGMVELFRMRIEELEGVYVGPPTGGGRVFDQMGWPGAFCAVAWELLEGYEATVEDADEEEFETGDPMDDLGVIE